MRGGMRNEAPGSRGHILATTALASRGDTAINDAEQVRDQVHAGHTESVGRFVRALASDDLERLVGLVVALAAAVPAEDIEDLLGWVAA